MVSLSPGDTEGTELQRGQGAQALTLAPGAHPESESGLFSPGALEQSGSPALG